jgi:uncharacterized membrane protein YdjX (TVP38/TMEM64 family)
MSDPSAAAPRAGRFRGWWRPLVPVVILLGGQFLLQRAGVDPGAMLHWLTLRHDDAAQLLFVLVGAAMCFLGVPRQVVAYAAGSGFGPWLGTALAVLAATVGCVASFLCARLVVHDWVERRFAARIGGINRFLAANTFSTTLMLRLLPVGNNLVLNLAAGASGVATLPFLAGSVVGYVPQSLVFAVLGAGMTFGHQTLLGLGVALFAVSAAIGVWLVRRRR